VNDVPRTRRALDRRGELLGSLFSALAAAQFAFVVIFGKKVQAGELPFVMLSIRFAGHTAILVGALLLVGRPLVPQRGERLPLVLAGTIGYGTESALFFSALNHGKSGAITLLFYTYPVLVMLATIALDRRPPASMLFVALGLAVGGSVIVIAGGGNVEAQPLGILLALCTAVAYTSYLVATDRTVKRTDPITAAAWLGAGASVANLVYAFAFRSVVIPSGSSWFWLGGMCLFSAGAFAAMLAGLQLVGAVRNAIIGVMEPFTVAVLAAVFLNESIAVATGLGGALILVGAVMASLARGPRLVEPDV
jgi:drug/metabolite transporter (DMT)-like permease